MTHGIYGSGANWRTIARKVVEARPDWSIVLVDLRNHGRSESGEPPHDLAACAGDLRALHAELPQIVALAGHSFGGKVVLATRPLLPSLVQTWIFDASPSPRPFTECFGEDDPRNPVARVLSLLERLPTVWTSRNDFVAAVIAAGHAEPLARWLAMNLDAEGDTFVLRLDLAAMHEMLQSYYVTDLWHVVDSPTPGEVHIVVATQSLTVSLDDRDRLAASPPHVHMHSIDAAA